jgi:hypothetical protein
MVAPTSLLSRMAFAGSYLDLVQLVSFELIKMDVRIYRLIIHSKLKPGTETVYPDQSYPNVDCGRDARTYNCSSRFSITEGYRRTPRWAKAMLQVQDG